MKTWNERIEGLRTHSTNWLQAGLLIAATVGWGVSPEFKVEAEAWLDQFWAVVAAVLTLFASAISFFKSLARKRELKAKAEVEVLRQQGGVS